MQTGFRVPHSFTVKDDSIHDNRIYAVCEYDFHKQVLNKMMVMEACAAGNISLVSKAVVMVEQKSPFILYILSSLLNETLTTALYTPLHYLFKKIFSSMLRFSKKSSHTF